MENFTSTKTPKQEHARSRSAGDLATFFGARFDENVESIPALKKMFVTAHVNLEHSKKEAQYALGSLAMTTEMLSTFEKLYSTLETKFEHKDAEFTEDILALKADNLALKANNLALKTDNLALKADNIAFHTKVGGLKDMF
jgi:hypothetical protein